MAAKYDIHFCLISVQAAANLLPILDPQFKPKKAVFLVSNKMKEQAKFLKNTVEKLGVNVVLENLADIFEFAELEDRIADIVSQYESEDIALNVTGGTKLMAIAAQNVFSMADKPIFYMDTDKNRIVFVSQSAEKKRMADIHLSTKITMENYLMAYGHSVVSEQKLAVNESELDLVKEFIHYYDRYRNLIPQLNGIASRSENSGYKTALEHKELKQNGLTDFLFELHDEEIIAFDGERVNFKNKATKEKLNGGWLEEVVFSELKNINKVQDISLNLEVGNTNYNPNKSTWDEKNKGNKNEFDVVFIANNKLHIVECKTAIMQSKKSADKPESILYKLEALKDYGGLMTKKCLVSYFELNEADRNRAKELKIEVIHGKELQQLKSKIQNWIGK